MTRIATPDSSTATLDEGPATRKPRLARRDVASIDRYSGPMSGKKCPREGLIGVADLDRSAANREKITGGLNCGAPDLNENAVRLNAHAATLV